MIRLEESVSETKLLSVIEELNGDMDVDGILVQLPLPKHISDEQIILAIDPSKDVDGFHPVNVGKLVLGTPSFISATPHGIMLLLEHYKIYRGKTGCRNRQKQYRGPAHEHPAECKYESGKLHGNPLSFPYP